MAGVNLTVPWEARPSEDGYWETYTAKTGVTIQRGSIVAYDITNDTVIAANETDAGAVDPAALVVIGVARSSIKTAAAAGAQLEVWEWGPDFDFQAANPVAANVREVVWAAWAVDPKTVTLTQPAVNQLGIVGQIIRILKTGATGIVRVRTKFGGLLKTAIELT